MSLEEQEETQKVEWSLNSQSHDSFSTSATSHNLYLVSGRDLCWTIFLILFSYYFSLYLPVIFSDNLNFSCFQKNLFLSVCVAIINVVFVCTVSILYVHKNKNFSFCCFPLDHNSDKHNWTIPHEQVCCCTDYPWYSYRFTGRDQVLHVITAVLRFSPAARLWVWYCLYTTTL